MLVVVKNECGCIINEIETTTQEELQNTLVELSKIIDIGDTISFQ